MANQIRLKRASGSDPGASDLVTGEIAVRTDTGKLFTKKDDGSVAEISGGGISDGDKGDITVSSSGATFTIDNGVISTAKIADDAVTFDKLENVENNRLLGRVSSGAGNAEELTQSQVRTLLNVENGATADQSASEIVALIADQTIAPSTIDMEDDEKIKLGTGDDLQIYHDGSDSFIEDAGTGTLRILSDDVRIMNAAGTEISAQFIQDGEARLKFDNSTKLATKTGGVDVTGNITVSGTVDGRDVATDGSKLDGIASGATNVSTENIQDIVGGMVTGNTETGITVTYQDGDGTLDFVVGTLNQDTTGNAATATALETARTIGGTSFDGTGNITPAECTNADTVDSLHASSFVRSDASDTLTGGTYTFDSSTDQKIILQGSTNPYIRFKQGTTEKAFIQWQDSNNCLRLRNQEDNAELRIKDDLQFSTDASTFYSIWHAGNDGSGSGLDADTLDGQEGSYYRNASNINAGTISDARLPSSISSDITGNSATATKLATARTIAGVSFDGSANISLNNNAITNGAGYLTSVDTSDIANDAVTYAKIQNVSATNRILGRDSSGAGVIEEITPANLRTMLNVANGANVGIAASGGEFTGDITTHDVIPDGNNTRDLGSSSARWANLFVNDMHFANSPENVNAVDGTWGDWTLQEGEETIYMLNNRNGKKYKMNLTEIV
jgi:hypothetical protein